MSEYLAQAGNVILHIVGDDEGVFRPCLVEPFVGLDYSRASWRNVQVIVSREPPPAMQSGPLFRLASGVGWVMAYDVRSSTGWAWFERGRAIDPWQVATPFRLIIAWALEPTHALVHAAAVSFDREGGYEFTALVGGPSGSGKSTTAAACRSSFRCHIFGDDWVVLGADHRVGQVYQSLKLGPSSPAIEEAKDLVELPLGHEKSVFLLKEAHTVGGALDVVVVPSISGRDEIAIRKISGSEALKRIGPSTVLQSPQTEMSLDIMAAAFVRLPCYELIVGRDVSLVPHMLEALCHT